MTIALTEATGQRERGKIADLAASFVGFEVGNLYLYKSEFWQKLFCTPQNVELRSLRIKHDGIKSPNVHPLRR